MCFLLLQSASLVLEMSCCSFLLSCTLLLHFWYLISYVSHPSPSVLPSLCVFLCFVSCLFLHLAGCLSRYTCMFVSVSRCLSLSFCLSVCLCRSLSLPPSCLPQGSPSPLQWHNTTIPPGDCKHCSKLWKHIASEAVIFHVIIYVFLVRIMCGLLSPLLSLLLLVSLLS